MTCRVVCSIPSRGRPRHWSCRIANDGNAVGYVPHDDRPQADGDECAYPQTLPDHGTGADVSSFAQCALAVDDSIGTNKAVRAHFHPMADVAPASQ